MPLSLSAVDRVLFKSIQTGNLAGVRLALTQGANLDARLQFDTPLLTAVLRNQVDIASFLVEAGAAICNVKNSRDPLVEAFQSGSVEMVGALLQVPRTPEAVARALSSETAALANLLLRSNSIRCLLLGQRWTSTWKALCEQGHVNAKWSLFWWDAACSMHEPAPESVDLLDQHAPLAGCGSGLLEIIGKHTAGEEVLKRAKAAGVLTPDFMFSNRFGSHRGLLHTQLASRHGSAKSRMFLVRHAATLPDGKEELKEASSELVAYALGLHGSLPLTRAICQKAGLPMEQVVRHACTPQGKTVLHLLLDGNADLKRRLDLACWAIECGVNPMALDQAGVPACYGALFFRDQTPEALDRLGRLGADFSPEGPLRVHLDREQHYHFFWIDQAVSNMQKWQARMQKQHLEAASGVCETTARQRRF